eukprot:Hpha_TRINITY_DN15699_c2_g1::TRINITY_DN15699_c2_g1_i2::g.98465::m.98465
MAEQQEDSRQREQKEAQRRAASERRYRIGRANTRDYQEQIQKEIRRLGVEKETLRKDNDRLKAEIAVKRAPGLSARSEKTPHLAAKNKEIDRRKEELIEYERRMETERKRSDLLDVRLMEYRVRYVKLRGDPKMKRSGRPYSARAPGDESWRGKDWIADCQVISVNYTSEAHTKIDRQVKVLENRLDRALVRFNEALHINKQLREQIDNLRRERGVFDAIYKKLERELQEKKKEMAFIIEVSNIAYEEKDNAINELDTLKMFAKKEMDSFQETFAELDELLEEDRKMKEAIKARMAERREKQVADQKADEDARKKKNAKGGGAQQQSATTAPQFTQAEGQMTLQTYEDAFAKIRQATACNDISQLVTTFLHSEDDNFSLFNYVNELNREMERLEKERDSLITEIEAAKGHGTNQADLGRQHALKQLEVQLKEAEQQNEKFVKALQETDSTLEEVKRTVELVFAQVDGAQDKIVAVSGASEGGAPEVSTGNLLLHLAAIELKTDEYLASWHRQEAKDGSMPPSQ